MKNHRTYPRLYSRDYLLIRDLSEKLERVASECFGIVLDYGCGTKPFKELFRRASNYVGVDTSVSESGDLVLNENGTIPFSNGGADSVVSFSVLEHVPDVSLYLKECLRVLKPGGKLILCTHGIWPYHPVPGNYEDYWRWTGSGLERITEVTGFQVDKVEEICGGWLSITQQALVVSDPWVQPRSVIYRRFKSAVTLIVNALSWWAYQVFGVRKPRRGDIVPILFLLVARKPSE